MPTNYEELECAFYATREELTSRIDELAAVARDEPIRVYNTVTESIADLQAQFDALVHDVNEVLIKLQECSRREEPVDEVGGPLDEFIAQFVRH